MGDIRLNGNMEKPLVSVIVPNYNHAKFLEKRIKSILNQEYTNLELILLDDCSKDSSTEILLKFSSYSKVTHVLLNEINSGSTFAQWNKGIGFARGEFIWIAESDDWCEPSFLEKVISKFSSYPNVGLVYCQSWKANENDQVIGSWKEWTDQVDSQHWNKDYMNFGKDELQNYFYLRNTIPNASAVVFKRDLFEPLNEEVMSMRLCGDKMVWTTLLLKTDIYFIAEPLNYFRQHNHNVRSSIKSLQNLYENFVWFNYFLNHVPLERKKQKEVKLWLFNWWKNVHKGVEARKFIFLILMYAARMDVLFACTLIFNLTADAKKNLWKRWSI